VPGAQAAVSSRVTAVNLISVTWLPRVPLQRIGFWFSKAPDWWARLFEEQALQLQFKTFNFLHTARWVSLGRFPRVAETQPSERFRNRWVLYTANYDGDWRPYFGTFMEAMSEGVYDLWGQSVGYPDFPAPGTAYELEAWLDSRIKDSQHYYAAYPHATANDVRAAVMVRREACSAALDLQNRGTPDDTDVSDVFDEISRRVRHCLGPIDPAPWPEPTLAPNGQITGVVTVFPILPGHEEEMTQAIGSLRSGANSPFRRVPGVHFARLALLDRNEIGVHPHKTVPVRNSYLLFTADFDSVDGYPDLFFRSVFQEMTADVDSVWQHCWGFERSGDDRDFTALARRCSRPVLREFIDCPDQSLASVLRSLGSQRVYVSLAQARFKGGSVKARDLYGFLHHQPTG
jgi:hypothetical protein